MLVSEVIDKVSVQLVDINNLRWTRPELLDFFNLGLSAFIIKRPDVARTTATISTAAALVPMPVDGYSIINVNHVDFRGVQYVDINKLTQLSPTWRSAQGAPTAWTRNEFDNDTVYLYPAPLTPVNVELVYAKNIKVAAESETFPIKDIYESILFDFMIYRAFNKDSANPGEAEKAKYHLMLFKDAIGDKDAADALKEQILQKKELQR